MTYNQMKIKPYSIVKIKKTTVRQTNEKWLTITSGHTIETNEKTKDQTVTHTEMDVIFFVLNSNKKGKHKQQNSWFTEAKNQPKMAQLWYLHRNKKYNRWASLIEFLLIGSLKTVKLDNKRQYKTQGHLKTILYPWSDSITQSLS